MQLSRGWGRQKGDSYVVPMKPTRIGSTFLLLGLIAACSVGVTLPQEQGGRANLHGRVETLIVGGGPNKKYNQAGIESNVRYVDLLLPSESARRVLFADGDRSSKSVFCEGDKQDYFREPKLAHIDGPSSNTAIDTELASMAKAMSAKPETPALIYFTGHGGANRKSDFQDNYYCTWKDDQLPVTDLATSIARFPKTTPIVLVMVECYSGAFGNLLFEDGQPDSELVDRPICGFFAATAQRMSAGCTPEVNEADYRDFTGYFFAALSGFDRLGKRISGADYDHDGKVTMDEAYAYTLIHDDSIDTPVCTSDVFLRRYVKIPDADCFDNTYQDVSTWATPAQRAALDALKATLGLHGAGDMQDVYHEFRQADPVGSDSRTVHLIRFCRLYKTIGLTHELMTAGDRQTQDRFKALVRREHTNPLVDRPGR